MRVRKPLSRFGRRLPFLYPQQRMSRNVQRYEPRHLTGGGQIIREIASAACRSAAATTRQPSFPIPRAMQMLEHLRAKR